MVDNILISERDYIFNATRSGLVALKHRVRDDDILINGRLLKRVAEAAFRCPGFTQAQKAELALVSCMDISAKLAPYPFDWCVFKAIGPKRGCERDVLSVSSSGICI